ncbi:N-carbamoyl-L-amino acid amidohydrolase [Cyanobium sp. PCC 7001]|uniref:Zn-dependent hydrolase n=1 Tax=Cyanobium sp. PCC 7001 TaxID=180281 RepID=UPI0001804C4E|nr:Zn-dependent hydrolase [Cyanobium sp. PCC 7001]EDY39144.1 N-carbamoyl-L-amino acid amidohydrolase [Cyanobium sp. PCC 7001]
MTQLSVGSQASLNGPLRPSGLPLGLRANGDRLARSLEVLSQIGRLPSGAVRRLAFSDEDRAARDLVQDWMREAGMEVRIDAAGNLIGRYEGLDPQAPVLATGSHIDTVPEGGRYDGALGVMAGLEVVRVLAEQGERLHHPLEVIVFADEESSMVGCKTLVGRGSDDPASYVTALGLPIEDALASIGGDWEQRSSARRAPEEIAAFLELHVEQGGVLEAVGKEIGVVEGVVGQQRYTISVTGQANHAGTTPMGMRRDALTTAAQIILAVEDMALHFPGDPVATVGKLQVWPNAANIVPGRVEFTLDMRDLSHSVIDHMRAHLERKIENIAVASRTRIAMTPQFVVDPSPADPMIQEVITESCQQLGLSYTHLPSRASHDSQELGRLTAMGMIFVPSRDGVSHSADEFTSPEQCEQGVNVLLQSLIRLDASLAAS